MKYDFLEVEFLRGAIIAKMGKDDLYSGNIQSILQGAGVCPQSTRSVWNRGKATPKEDRCLRTRALGHSTLSFCQSMVETQSCKVYSHSDEFFRADHEHN